MAERAAQAPTQLGCVKVRVSVRVSSHKARCIESQTSLSGKRQDTEAEQTKPNVVLGKSFHFEAHEKKKVTTAFLF